MGSIIRIHEDAHRELQELLPWYVTGQLEAAEHARVDAHVESCPECQAEVRFQQRLEAEIARLPLEVEEGWTQMKRRLEAEEREAPRPAAPIRGWRAGTPWLGWGMAAALAVVAGIALAPPDRSAPAGAYHTLSSAPVAQPGNLVVIFRPDITEKAMREALNASEARLVDGPTAADAYVLRVPAARRAAVLAELRERKDVVLAEPLDPGAAP